MTPPDPRITLVTLGVQDLPRAIAFYGDGLGWRRSSVGGDEVAFFHTGGIVLALYPRDALAADAGMPAGEPAPFPGFALAHNVRERERVDRTLAHVRHIGGRIVKEATDASWGGRSGYFADPDGFLWEVAWNPGFPLREDGTVVLPE